MNAVRVLLADDEPLVRAGLRLLLDFEPDIDVVAEASDGEQALALLMTLQPDVAVMDVRMPGLDGIAAIRRVKDGLVEVSGVNFLVLTSFNTDSAVYGALRAGAAGFLLKDSAPAELVAAVRAVARGEGWLDPTVTPALIREFAARPEQDVPTSADFAALTPREREVLVLVARGLSNTDIAGLLVVGEGTVKTHVNRILLKLGVRSRAAAVAAAWQSGLVRTASAPPGT